MVLLSGETWIADCGQDCRVDVGSAAFAVGKIAKMPRPKMLRRILALGCALGLGLAPGCARPRTTQPPVAAETLSDPGFLAYLTEIPVVTVDEAYRAMLILADGQDDSESFDLRREKLESRGIARPAWNLQPKNVIDVGSVSFMICRICQIRGGVNLRLFGEAGLGDRRYAMRELIYRGILEDAVDYQYVTGSTMFALVRKADAYMEETGLYESPVELSDETDRDEKGELIVPPPASPAADAGA